MSWLDDPQVEQPTETFFSFDKPLSREAEWTLKLLMERYTDGQGQPLVRFETDSLVTLRVPHTVKRKSFSKPFDSHQGRI